MLSLYRARIALRRAKPDLALGSYRLVLVTGDLLIFERAHEGQQLLVALNLGAQSISWTDAATRGRILLSTYMDRQAEAVDGTLDLRRAEGLIIELLR